MAHRCRMPAPIGMRGAVLTSRLPMTKTRSFKISAGFGLFRVVPLNAGQCDCAQEAPRAKKEPVPATGPRSRVSGALLYVMFVQVPCPTAMALLVTGPRLIEPRAKAVSARPHALGPSHLIVHQHLPGRHACRKAGDVFDHGSTPLQHNCGGKRRYSALEISTFAFSQSAIASVELRTAPQQTRNAPVDASAA